MPIVEISKCNLVTLVGNPIAERCRVYLLDMGENIDKYTTLHQRKKFLIFYGNKVMEEANTLHEAKMLENTKFSSVGVAIYSPNGEISYSLCCMKYVPNKN